MMYEAKPIICALSSCYTQINTLKACATAKNMYVKQRITLWNMEEYSLMTDVWRSRLPLSGSVWSLTKQRHSAMEYKKFI